MSEVYVLGRDRFTFFTYVNNSVLQFLEDIIRYFDPRELGSRVRIIFVWISVKLIEEILPLPCRPSEDVLCVQNIYRRSGVEQSDCSNPSGLSCPSIRHLNPASQK